MIQQPIERAFRRSGIEGPFGQALALPWRGVQIHLHWCPDHDRRWECLDAPCLRYDASPCPISSPCQGDAA